MSIRISPLVLLLVTLAVTAELHHIDAMVDEILADLRTRFRPVLELDDLELVSRSGSLKCLNGTGSSLASLARHGHARQHSSLSTIKVWAEITMEPFIFRFEDCVIRNDTKYEFIGPVGGSTIFSSGLIQLTVYAVGNCLTDFDHFYMEDALVVFDQAYDNATIFQRFDRAQLMNLVKEDILSSVNLTLTEYTGLEYKQLKNC